MKIHQINDDNGQLHAFEVGNSLLGRKGVLKIVRNIPGVIVTEEPKLFSRTQREEFCRFQLDGQEFVVEEPFGDNSRYLISAVPPGPCHQFELVEKTFAKA